MLRHSSRLLRGIGLIALLGLMTLVPALAATVTLAPSRDNTLFETPDGSLSNGKGQYIFAGRTLEPSLRRALLAFDLSSIPAGSTIVSGTLTLNMSMTIAISEPTSLHRLTSDWGEGASDAPGQEGSGALATTGDATWLHTFYPTSFWTAPGGDFVATPSATTMVDQVGFYDWTSAGVVADLQAWLTSPATNYGWIMICNEEGAPSAKRFGSRESPTVANRPSLTIRYSPPGSAGSVPDGGNVPGAPLTVQRSGPMLSLAWGSSCTGSDTDYAIYEGTLGSFPSHHPMVCSTSGLTTKIVTPLSGNRYYLVVPRNASREGSYGRGSSGLDRPVGTPECLTQLLAECP